MNENYHSSFNVCCQNIKTRAADPSFIFSFRRFESVKGFSNVTVEYVKRLLIYYSRIKEVLLFWGFFFDSLSSFLLLRSKTSSALLFLSCSFEVWFPIYDFGFVIAILFFEITSLIMKLFVSSTNSYYDE